MLPREAIRHQTKFEFSFGRNKVVVDGTDLAKRESRADIILYYKDAPLAMLELKRPRVALKDDDLSQGLSYARVLNPSPPLVVASNGKDTRFISTHTGQEWQPTALTEEAFVSLVKGAAQVAAADLKLAISTLMGTNPDIWVQAVREASAFRIAELTGDWDERHALFTKDFRIPRKATAIVKLLLESGRKLICVEGAPLVGKSNVLRELTISSEKDVNLVVLFINVEERLDILQQVADALSKSLNWPVNKDEARNWLKHLSLTEGPKLVIAINGIGINLDKARDEIIDLTSEMFGARLALVVELDTTSADNAIRNSSGRKLSIIGRRIKRVEVQPLDDTEFEVACEVLAENRFLMINGAQMSPEFRLPWVLRSVSAYYAKHPNYRNLDLAAGIPPLLSMDLINHVRATIDEELRIAFNPIAKAVIEDAEDERRPVSLMLEAMGAFVVRGRTLKKHLSSSELKHLQQQGFLKLTIHDSGDTVFVIQFPELLASEASAVLAEQLGRRANVSSDDAAKWLSGMAAKLPLGDVIAAHAVMDAAVQEPGIPWNLVVALMEKSPRKVKIEEGARMAMHMPDVGMIRLTFKADGISASTTQGPKHFIQFDLGDEPSVTYDDVHGWLILSHLAGKPIVLARGHDDTDAERIDPPILIEVGKCPLILRRPGNNAHVSAILTHELEGHGSIVCYKAGIVEPITHSIFKFLSVEGENAAEWIQAAVSTGSFPLVARIDIALREVSLMADSKISEFAKKTLQQIIAPEVSKALPTH